MSDVFQVITQDPKFAALSYEAQQKVRDRLFRERVLTDPQFSRLSPGAQAVVYQKYVGLAKPVFQEQRYAQAADNPNIVNALLAPMSTAPLFMKGLLAMSNFVLKGIGKLTGVQQIDMWNSAYGADAIKLTQYAAHTLGNDNLPQIGATIGNIADWVVAAKLTGGVGLGVGKATAAAAGRAVAGDATGVVGKAVGRWVAAGKLTTEGAASTFSNTVLSAGAREFIVKSLLPQVVKSAGIGGVGVGRELIQGATQAPPWDPGITLNFQAVAKTFGGYAAMDYLLNVGLNTLAPFIRLTGKAVFGGKGLEVGGLSEIAKFSPEELEAFTRSLKLGTMDQVVWDGLHESVKDHLTALAQFDRIHAGGNGALAMAKDPSDLSMSLGFLTNHDVVPTGEPGKFRVRTSPGMGSEVLADGVGLPEVNRIVADRWQAVKAAALRTVESETRAVAGIRVKMEAEGVSVADRALLKEKLDSHLRKLEGSNITLLAYTSYDPYFQPMVKSIETARGAFTAELDPGALSINKRSAMTYAEASAVEQKPDVNAIRFRVDLPPGRLSGKEARVIHEGSSFSQVKEVKDFFIKQSDPFTITPAAGDFNGLLVYGHAVDDEIYREVVAGLKDLKSVVPVADLAQARLLSMGFDAIEHADGRITSLLPRNQIRHVSDLIDVKQGTYRAGVDVGRPAAKVGRTEGLSNRFLSSLGKDVIIKQSLGISLADKALSTSRQATIALMKTIYGDVKPSTVAKVAELYLQATEGRAGKVIVKTADIKPAEMKLEMDSQGRKVFTVPQRVVTPQEQRDFILKLGELLTERQRSKLMAFDLTKELGVGKSAKALSQEEVGKAFEEAYDRLAEVLPGTRRVAEEVKVRNIFASPLPNANDVEKMAWLSDAAVKSKNVKLVPSMFANAKGGTRLEFSDGTSFTSNIADDLVDEFLVHNTTAEHVRLELLDEGYRLVATHVKGNYFRVLDGKKVVGEGKTIPELLHNMNWRPSRIDSKFAPLEVQIGPRETVFTLRGSQAFGNINEAKKFLDKFIDPSQEATKRIIARTEFGKLTQGIGEHYTVEIPSRGEIRSFDNAAEARLYLERTHKEWSSIERLANERGMLFRLEGKRFKLVDETGSYFAKDLDEVDKILARSPDPHFAPNLIPNISEAEMAIAETSWRASYNPQIWTLPLDPSWAQRPLMLGNISRFYKPMHDWLIDFAKKSGHTRLAEIYQKMDGSLREAMNQSNNVRRLILFHLSDEVPRGPIGKALGRPPGVKLFPDDKLNGMSAYLEAVTSEDKAFAVKAHGLEPKHVAAADELRSLLDGEFKKFGIDSNLYLFSYLPRIRESAMKLGYGPADFRTMNDGDMEKFLSKTFKGKDNIPKELKFNSERGRLSELVDFARETNLAKILLKYNDQGHKKFFLNGLWKEMDDYLENAPRIGGVAFDYMNEYRKVVMGIDTDTLTKGVKNLGREVAHRLGMKDPAAGENLADMLYTVNTLTTQSFRVWLTARNMTQIYTTAAAVLGNEVVGQAGRELTKPGAMAAMIDVLRKRGTITEAPPLFNEIAHGDRGLGKVIGNVTEVGMRPMKRSDDITRAWAYRAAEIKWEAGFGRAQKGLPINLQEAVGWNLAHDEVAAKIGQLVAKGDPVSLQTAKHLFADDITRLTMYDYTRPNAAQMSHGFVGRAFGQYQIYPIYYASMVKHLFTHGTAMQRIGMVARLGGNAAAIAGALYAIGLDGKNSMPWVPLQVTGGPLYNLGLLMLQSTDTTGYRGRQARGELIGTISHLIPGSYELKMATDFLKYMDAGKPLLALYALTSAPIRPDLRQ